MGDEVVVELALRGSIGEAMGSEAVAKLVGASCCRAVGGGSRGSCISMEVASTDSCAQDPRAGHRYSSHRGSRSCGRMVEEGREISHKGIQEVGVLGSSGSFRGSGGSGVERSRVEVLESRYKRLGWGRTAHSGHCLSLKVKVTTTTRCRKQQVVGENREEAKVRNLHLL